MPLPQPSFDDNSREESSRVQTLSSVAPPPAQAEGAETTHDIPTLVPMQSRIQPLRTLGWVMVIGGAVALALVLVATKLRSAPAAQKGASPVPRAVPAAPQHVPEAQERPPTKTEPAQSTTQARRATRAVSAGPATEANETSIRIRARVAPVRAAPEPDAKVVCSLKRGAVMRSIQQTSDAKARWFAVNCDKDSPGWVHENFVVPVRP
jgi:hypothetical protein